MGFMDNLRGPNSNLISLGLNNNSNSNYDGGLDDFANQILNFKKGQQEHQSHINDVLMQHQLTPINRYSRPLTTNPLISTGINAPNPEVETRVVPNQITPLEMAKLRQTDEKLAINKEKNKSDLQFKESKQDTDSKIRQQRADIYDYRTKHPDHKFDFSGPTVKVMDPKTGSVYDTGAETGKLSMEDKLNLMSKNDVMRDSNRINMTEGSNLRRDDNASANRLGEIAARGDQTRQTNDAKPNNKTTSNTQAHQGYLNKAEELANSNPQYAPYLKLVKSDNGKVNGFTVNPVNGADDPIYHEINSKIYGGVGDVEIPSNDKNKSDKSKDKSKNNEDKGAKADPLGIRK